MADPFVAEIRIFPFNFAPKGWAWCDGQLLPLSQNTALFSLLGTTYGGDGKSNFALPALQGRAAMHPGQGPGLSLHDLGESRGSDTTTLLESEIPAHAHTLKAASDIADVQVPSPNRSLARSQNANAYQSTTNANLVALAPEALAPAGGDQPHNNLQPYLTCYFNIALQGVFPPANLISLRPVGPDDEAFLLGVYASTRQAELALVDWDDDQKAAFCRQQFFAQRAWYEEQYVGASFQVVEVDGTSAGRLYVDRWPEEIRIVDVSLLPGFRARGIGSALIRELQQEASASAKALSIHVERFNRALSLYRRLGFEAAGEHGVYLLLRWSPGAGGNTAVTAG